MPRIITTILIGCMATIAAYAFEGTYDVKGYDPYEKMPYTGTVTISKDDNGVYQAAWDLKEGGKKYKEVGTGLNCNKDKISFMFKGIENEIEEEGLQLYTRKDEKTLEGPYVLLDQNLIGKETLTKK